MDTSASMERNTLSEHLRISKLQIRRILADQLAQKKLDLQRVGTWGPDVALRLHEFTERGKMIRGALVLLASDLFGRMRNGEELKVAAAVELMQSALLVHDDIIDRDRYRRGRESIYAQYTSIGQSHRVAEPAHFGESMGICTGDVAIFTGFELLGGLNIGRSALSSIISLVSKEMTCVGIAQMQDVYHGQAAIDVTERDVYRLYLYKTGRYTFSLPLMIGGILGGAVPRSVDTLAQLGERLGVIFQMKDDEIGLFGNSDETGKPSGSDIAEGKKTLYRLRLMRQANSLQRVRLATIFRRRHAGPLQIAYVRKLVEELGIREELSAEMVRLADEAHAIVDSIEGVDHNGREIVHELVTFNVERST